MWHLTDHRQFQFSGFYRYYTLDVRPNFGDGLIRQSEHRNVNSEDVLYTDRFSKSVSLLAGFDQRREAPRDLNLDKFDEAARRENVDYTLQLRVNGTMNYVNSPQDHLSETVPSEPSRSEPTRVLSALSNNGGLPSSDGNSQSIYDPRLSRR